MSKMLTVKVKVPDPSRTDEQAVLLRKLEKVIQRVDAELAAKLVASGTHEYTTKAQYKKFLKHNPHLAW